MKKGHWRRSRFDLAGERTAELAEVAASGNRRVSPTPPATQVFSTERIQHPAGSPRRSSAGTATGRGPLPVPALPGLPDQAQPRHHLRGRVNEVMREQVAAAGLNVPRFRGGFVDAIKGRQRIQGVWKNKPAEAVTRSTSRWSVTGSTPSVTANLRE